MHEFKFQKNELYCEKVKVAAIADAVDTPTYVYSHATYMDHYKKLAEAFKSLKPLICYSMKANSNLAVCRDLVKAGSGIDIVSGGELFRALQIKTPPKKIVYASVGKTQKEIAEALRAGILSFNVESPAEMAMINDVAKRLKKKARVALRVNPNVDAKTHRFITTGTKENKFGMPIETCYELFAHPEQFPAIALVGIHVHIGSQITSAEPFVTMLDKVGGLIIRIRQHKNVLEYLNIGGGLGIIYNDEKPQTAKDFARAVIPSLKKIGLKIILEPGRFIVGNAGILLTRVLYVKETGHKTFVIVDAAMNDLARPSLYGAYHEIVPVMQAAAKGKKASPHMMVTDIVGPICESGDFLAKDRRMPPVKAGDLLAVMSAGAYGFTMSSNYNSRRRSCEVLVKGSRHTVVRKRETYKDLIRGEVFSS